MRAPSTVNPSLRPRHWPIWAAFGMLRAATLLPMPVQRILGRLIGRLFRLFGRRRAGIARINVDLCFPELGDAERAALVRRHFEAFGIGLFELGFGWWGTNQRLRRLVTAHGLEHLHKALERGKGVILLSAHFTTLEIGGRLLALCADGLPLKALYRPSEHPVMERMVRSNRERQFGTPIPREDIRAMLRALKRGEAVWYASDQNFGHKGSVFAPFFGIPAATNTATTRLASMTGAVVVPFFTRRLPDGRYEQIISPALDNFPGPTPETDAERINRIIEDWVRQAPEQYFWTHRRFKDRPDDGPRFY
jgi:Kdo2-lipid IVA lauroyltransferase/acyltransferase